jgi:hypothetical protein
LASPQVAELRLARARIATLEHNAAVLAQLSSRCVSEFAKEDARVRRTATARFGADVEMRIDGLRSCGEDEVGAAYRRCAQEATQLAIVTEAAEACHGWLATHHPEAYYEPGLFSPTLRASPPPSARPASFEGG